MKLGLPGGVLLVWTTVGGAAAMASGCGETAVGGGLAERGGVARGLELIGAGGRLGEEGGEAGALIAGRVVVAAAAATWMFDCATMGMGLTPCQMSASWPLHQAMQTVGSRVAGTR